MNNRDNYQIDGLEMAISLLAVTPGIGFLIHPRVLTEVTNTADGWLSIIICGLLAMGVIILYTRLQRQYPGQNLLEYIGQGKLGYWVAKGLALLFIVFFVAIMAYELNVVTTVTKLYLLIITPPEVTGAIMILLTAYAVSKGTQGIIHLNLMFVPFTLMVIIGMLLFNIPNLNFNELRPFLPEGISPVLSGTKVAFPAFIGIEIIFFFMASMKVSQIRALPLNMSIGFLTVLNVLVTASSIAVFGLQATKLTTFPIVELVKEIEIPGGFFERVESIMITVWMMSIFNALSIGYLLVVQTVQAHFTPRVNKIWLTASVAFIVIILTFVPKSITEAFTMGKWTYTMGLILIIVGLGCGYLSYWTRKQHQMKV